MDRSYLNRWASLTGPVGYTDPERHSRYDMIDSVAGTHLPFGRYRSWWLFRHAFCAMPRPVRS